MLTFTTDLPEKDAPPGSCLCAQHAPRFFEAVDLELAEQPLSAELAAHLAAYAYPNCTRCHGTGLVPGPPAADTYVQVADWPSLLAAMDLPDRGSCTLPEARRAIIRALNVDLRAFHRAPATLHGAPRVDASGVVQLRPTIAFVRGCSAEDIRDRARWLADFVERSARQGATRLVWS